MIKHIFLEDVYGQIGTVYHRTRNVKNLQGLKMSGFHVGTGAMYGEGIYFTSQLQSTMSYDMASSYGQTLMKARINLNRFLIFIPSIAKKTYGANWRLASQLKLLKMDVNKLGANIKYYVDEFTTLEDGIESGKINEENVIRRNGMSGTTAMAFKEMGNLPRYANGMLYYNDGRYDGVAFYPHIALQPMAWTYTSREMIQDYDNGKITELPWREYHIKGQEFGKELAKNQYDVANRYDKLLTTDDFGYRTTELKAKDDKGQETGDSKYGMINPKGEEIIPAIYSQPFQFSSFNGKKDKDSLYAVTAVENPEDKYHNMYGIINGSGTHIVPNEYKSIRNFNLSGQKFFKLHGFDDKVSIVSGAGKVYIAPKYYNIEVMADANGDKIPFFVVTDKDGNAGIIDLKGYEVMPPKYGGIEVAYYLNNKLHIFIKKTSKTGARLTGVSTVGQEGEKEIIPPIYAGIEPIKINNMYKYLRVTITGNRHGGYQGLLDMTGKQLIETIYEKVYDVNENTASVILNGLRGIVDIKTGDDIIEPQYTTLQLQPTLKDIYLVSKEGEKFNFYSLKSKEEIFDTWFDSVEEFGDDYGDGIYKLKKRKKTNVYGLVNFKTGTYHEPQFTEMTKSRITRGTTGTYIYVKTPASKAEPSKFGFMTLKGEWKLPLKYETRLDSFDTNGVGYMIVELGGKVGIVTADDEVKVPFDYASVNSMYSDGETRYFRVKKDDLFGVITLENEVTIPIEYKQIISDGSDTVNLTGTDDTAYIYSMSEKKIIFSGEYSSIREWGYTLDDDRTLYIVGNTTQDADGNPFARYGIVNSDKKEIVPVKYDGHFGSPDQRKNIMVKIADGKGNEKIGLYSLTDAKELIPCEYDWISQGYSRNYAYNQVSVAKSGAGGNYLNGTFNVETGVVGVPLMFWNQIEFSDGFPLAKVQLRDSGSTLYGVYEYTGKEIIPPIYFDISGRNKKIWRLKDSDSKYGWADYDTGEIVVEPKFQQITDENYDSNRDYIIVRNIVDDSKNGLKKYAYGLYRASTGAEVLPVEYDNLSVSDGVSKILGGNPYIYTYPANDYKPESVSIFDMNGKFLGTQEELTK